MSLASIITTSTIRRRYQRHLNREAARRASAFIRDDWYSEPPREATPSQRADRADAYYREVYGLRDDLAAAMEAIRKI